jgi:hypothetical protein
MKCNSRQASSQHRIVFIPLLSSAEDDPRASVLFTRLDEPKIAPLAAHAIEVAFAMGAEHTVAVLKLRGVNDAQCGVASRSRLAAEFPGHAARILAPLPPSSVGLSIWEYGPQTILFTYCAIKLGSRWTKVANA